MASIGFLIGGALVNALAFTGSNYLFSSLSKESIEKESRAVNPPFLAGRLPVLEAVSLSPYFKRNLPVFENNQFLNTKVYKNDMRKNSLFSFTNFLGSA